AAAVRADVRPGPVRRVPVGMPLRRRRLHLPDAGPPGRRGAHLGAWQRPGRPGAGGAARMILVEGRRWGTAAQIAAVLGPDVTPAMVRWWAARKGLTAVRAVDEHGRPQVR